MSFFQKISRSYWRTCFHPINLKLSAIVNRYALIVIPKDQLPSWKTKVPRGFSKRRTKNLKSRKRKTKKNGLKYLKKICSHFEVSPSCLVKTSWKNQLNISKDGFRILFLLSRTIFPEFRRNFFLNNIFQYLISKKFEKDSFISFQYVLWT